MDTPYLIPQKGYQGGFTPICSQVGPSARKVAPWPCGAKLGPKVAPTGYMVLGGCFLAENSLFHLEMVRKGGFAKKNGPNNSPLTGFYEHFMFEAKFGGQGLGGPNFAQ